MHAKINPGQTIAAVTHTTKTRFDVPDFGFPLMVIKIAQQRTIIQQYDDWYTGR